MRFQQVKQNPDQSLKAWPKRYSKLLGGVSGRAGLLGSTGAPQRVSDPRACGVKPDDVQRRAGTGEKATRNGHRPTAGVFRLNSRQDG